MRPLSSPREEQDETVVEQFSQGSLGKTLSLQLRKLREDSLRIPKRLPETLPVLIHGIAEHLPLEVLISLFQCPLLHFSAIST